MESHNLTNMFKRLAPVLEISESRSESESPAHKRSYTQLRSRLPGSPQNSDVQVWNIIQSRRNLDKKIRGICSRGQKRSGEREKGSKSGTIESPCNKSLGENVEAKWKNSSFEQKKGQVQMQNRLRKNKSNENREKHAERASKARADVKLQSALDSEFIKRREEIIYQQKKEKVDSIKNSLKNSKHKRGSSSNALKELNSSEYLLKIHRLNELNRTAESSLKQLQVKEEIMTENLRISSGSKENIIKALTERTYTSILSPKRVLV